MNLVHDQKTGAVDEEASIQAGSEALINFKRRAEADLWFFGKFVLGYSLLTPHLHREVTEFIQTLPPYRKLLLLPRNHYKSTISRAFAIHLFIQPDGRNVYFPNRIPMGRNVDRGHSDGRSTRILLSSKTADLAELNLGEIATIMESNVLLKSLWPNCFWDEPRKAVRTGECKAWNNKTLYLPRSEVIREGSIETIGVGGTRTGYHFDVNIHDDLIDIKDRNSAAEMETAIEWHKASRAFLQDEDRSLEFILGTHWAVNDLYTHIIEDDPTVESYVRAMVENGKPIMPESYDMAQVERMKRQYGTLFPLLFMNDAHDPELVAFDWNLVRRFTFENGQICFDEDERDAIMRGDFDREEYSLPTDDRWNGQRMSPDVLKTMIEESKGREEYLSMKYS